MSNVLTCVYCGMQYPEGTPPSKDKLLTDHIEVCEKHPLKLEKDKVVKLRKALCDLIGSSDEDELKQMELALRSIPGVESDKISAINAIHAILETR